MPASGAIGSASAATPSTVPAAPVSSSALPPSAAVPTGASASLAPVATAPASDSHADLLRYARDELAAGRFENARRSLERLVSLYPNAGDESWYLLGRVYEEPGPLRDIRKAHAAYKRVRDEWPESAWWQDAADRLAAIERRYFDIR
jgi:tetratricopeptide (TPR) repeat protein